MDNKFIIQVELIQKYYNHIINLIKTISNMNLDKTQYQSNLRATKTPGKMAFFQNQMTDDSLRKSYMFQAVAKFKKQQQIFQVVLEEISSTIQDSEKIKRKNKIFKSVLKTANKTNKFRVLMSNIIPSKNTLSCCNVEGVRQPVIVQLSQFKEMTIRNAKQTQILYHFNFNTIQAKAESQDLDTSIFTLNICKKIILKFQNNTETQHHAAQQLKKIIYEMINHSLGQQYQMQNLKQIENFEKLRYKPVTDFLQNCQTGDLLLFRGNLFWAKVQRFVLGSDYDHVGMIYKDPVHGILIFQATSFRGICLSPFEMILKYKWYQFIDRIAWRKLNKIERDVQFIKQIQQLILDKLGTVYNISFDKLMSNKSYIYHVPKTNPQTEQAQKQIHQTEQQKRKKKKAEQVGYFCSELVAKIYKGMKLLTSNEENSTFKPSCNFYPYHFTEKFRLQMLKGQLSHEYIINFNADQINDYFHFQN